MAKTDRPRLKPGIVKAYRIFTIVCIGLTVLFFLYLQTAPSANRSVTWWKTLWLILPPFGAFAGALLLLTNRYSPRLIAWIAVGEMLADPERTEPNIDQTRSASRGEYKSETTKSRSMYCPSCGEEIADDSAFCPECGANIGTKTESISPDTKKAKTAADNSSGWKTKLGKVVAYAVGIFLILSGLGGLSESVAAGVIMLIGGVIALPVARSKLDDSQGVAIGMWATVVIVIVSVVAGGVLYNVADSGPAVETNGGNGETTGGNGETTGGNGEQTPPPETTSEPTFDYELNESFVVSDGEQPIEYTVQKSYTTDIIDPGGSRRQPDGEFLVVIMELENVGDEPVDVRTRHLKLVNEDDQEFGADTRTTIDVGYDHRIGVEGLTSEQLQPGLPLERAVVFDVAPGQEYRLKTEPVGYNSDGKGYYVKLETQELE